MKIFNNPPVGQISQVDDPPVSRISQVDDPRVSRISFLRFIKLRHRNIFVPKSCIPLGIFLIFTYQKNEIYDYI
jgi:hypothetical protein